MQTMARRSSGTKGYTGYRGRRRGRGVLAVVLVVILLLACGFFVCAALYGIRCGWLGPL